MNPKIIVSISGPSLAGKTELSKQLEQYGFHSIISSTTRAPRSHEEAGKDYYFISEATFESQQWIQTTKFNGAHYGVQEAHVKGHEKCIWVIAPESIAQIECWANEQKISLIKVFVSNPLNIRVHRLLSRLQNDRNASVESYTKRLMGMIDQEESWIQDAEGGVVDYDLNFHEFHPENQNKVIESIFKKIEIEEEKNRINEEIKKRGIKI